MALVPHIAARLDERNQLMMQSYCRNTIATPLFYLRPHGAIAMGAIRIEVLFNKSVEVIINMLKEVYCLSEI